MNTGRRENRYKTSQSTNKQLQKMFFMAAQQKLLPKIIYEFSLQNNKLQLLHQYREYIKEIYTKQTLSPLVYNEDQAKSYREKFREKIMKLINNQLTVDYLKSEKINGKYEMTYKGQPLQKVQYKTLPQYKIFCDFSQSKFKKGYEDIFDDKLQCTYSKMLSPIRKQLPKKLKLTEIDLQIKQQKKQEIKTSHERLQRKKKQAQTFKILPKVIIRSQFQKHRLVSPCTIKKKIKKIKICNQIQTVFNTMKKIGGYSGISKIDISITKQSILKYFREFYLRPHRIVDFLEFQNVQNFNHFSKMPGKLKLMPIQHIYFMVFLYYDSNNDGYICNNDLIRIQEVSQKSKLIKQDYLLIKNMSAKIKYQSNIPYKQLYRLTQITQTTYFNWLKLDKTVQKQNPQNMEEQNIELKDYFEKLNKKKIFIHYQGFKKIFMNQKPYIWYDIVWRISGIQYDGLIYQ